VRVRTADLQPLMLREGLALFELVGERIKSCSAGPATQFGRPNQEYCQATETF
jgi:hypothetical protein